MAEEVNARAVKTHRHPELAHLDEALTSLQAIQRYDRNLNQTDVRQLVADAIQRIQLFVRDHKTDT